MKNLQVWLRENYVKFKHEVLGKCPKCGCTRIMHYSFYDMTDDSAHYAACMNDDCDWEEMICRIDENCPNCPYAAEQLHVGSFMADIVLPPPAPATTP